MSIKRKIVVSLVAIGVVLSATFFGGNIWLKQWVAEADSFIIDAEAPIAQNEKPEVVEFFSYGCPHCYSFEPAVERWLEANRDNVSFRRIPAVLGPDWMVPLLSKTPNFILAKTYYALVAMGKLDEFHARLFYAFHVEKVPLSAAEDVFAYLATQGVDMQAFRQHFDSEEISKNVEEARKYVSKYGVRATPTIVVNGHFRASLRTAEYDNSKLISKVDEFILASTPDSSGTKSAHSML